MSQPDLFDPRDKPGEPATKGDAQDERDYEAFAQDQDPLDIEAATWVARRRNGLDARGEAELHAWLAADPTHQAAFDDMDDTFGRLRDMPDEEIESLKAGLHPGEVPTSPPAHVSAPVDAIPPAKPIKPPCEGQRTPPRVAAPGRRAWLLGIGRFVPQAAMAAVALSVVGGGWLGWEHWRHQPTFGKSYATARGQQLQVNLPDGSHLLLDTATQAEVRLYRDRREVHLREGQVLFSVQADASQPFHVLTGTVRVTVVGTRFSVRHTRTGLDEGDTRVVVEQGRVRVARIADDETRDTGSVVEGGSSVELTAGQAIVADKQGYLGQVASVPRDSAAPWRDGRVSFDNTPLVQALAEFERYGVTGLVVRDPVVAALRVGGSFNLRNFPSFVRALPQQLPVRLEHRDGVLEVVGIR